jgi:hypothetical protein
MAIAQKIEGRKLIVLRMAGIAMIIAFANYAYTGYITGVIEVGTRRHSFIMADENLWLGFLFLISSATISIFLLFINHSQTKTFNNLARIFGGTWFVIFGACILTHMSNDNT